jgi:hypothetical protein
LRRPRRLEAGASPTKTFKHSNESLREQEKLMSDAESHAKFAALKAKICAVME